MEEKSVCTSCVDTGNGIGTSEPNPRKIKKEGLAIALVEVYIAPGMQVHFCDLCSLEQE